MVDAFDPTPTQQNMLANAMRDPTRGIEIEQLIVYLGEKVDPRKVQDAFEWAIAAHPALRSSFAWTATSIEQRVVSRARMPFEQRAGEPDADFLEADRTQGFDLGTPPLARVTYFEGATEDAFVFTFHHVILDGRSYRIVLEHVLDHLDGLPTKRPKPSFGDYARFLSARDPGAGLHHFGTVLEGVEQTTLPLPGTRPLPPGLQRVEARRVTLELDALIAVGERLGTTLPDAVLAAWSWVLTRITRSAELVLGTTRAGRVPAFEGVNDVVGCLINTLPMRIEVDANATAEDLLRSVRGQVIAMREHEHASLNTILARANVKLETLVVFERYGLEGAMQARGGKNASRRFRLHERSDIPLLLAIYQRGARLELVLEHDARALGMDEASLLLARLEAALLHLGHAPTRRLWELPLYVAGEAEKLIAWSQGRAPQLSIPSVSDAIAMQGVDSADNIAVRDSEGRELLYRELRERSRRIAGALHTHGAAPGSVVFVLLPRSVHWVAAMVGVWYAEATYLPLDPTWPEARLAEIHDDIFEHAPGAHLVLVDEATAPLAARALPKAKALPIGHAWEHARRAATADLRAIAHLGQNPLAYILYTSGTTGKPKGSRLPERALAAHAAAAIEAYGLRATDRVYQFTSLGFDVSIEEVVPTLLVGARLVLRSPRASSDFDALLGELERERISVLNLPSAYFHELMVHIEGAHVTLPPSVRLVIVGGERPTPESYARLVTLHQHLESPPRFINAYGPTEVTITSTACDVRAAGVPADGMTELPIGQGFGATRAYVVRVPEAPSQVRRVGARLSIEPPPLDAPQLACVECPGELWLAGPQVADGYLGRPEATRQVFVADPFAAPGEPDAMAYRTGDLVKRTATGQLVFLGRRDRQVKLRGHRIEPSEIESVLMKQPGVSDAAVVVAGEAHAAALVGFVTHARGATLESETLKAALVGRLPGYMVPSAIGILDAMPETPTGKIDRTELGRRGAALLRSSTRGMTEVPANDLEAWLRPIFAEALGRTDVELGRSIFEMGGHSLMAIRILARMKTERPEVTVDIALFVANPSVRQLAAALSTRQIGARTLVRLNPRSAETEGIAPLYCVLGVQLYAHLARAMELDRPVLGTILPVEEKVLTDPEAVLDFDSMARDYIALIREHQPEGPYIVGGLSIGGLVAYEVAQQLLAAGQDVRAVVFFDTILPSLLRLSIASRMKERLGALTERFRGQRDAAPSIRETVLRRSGEAYERRMAPLRAPIILFSGNEGDFPRDLRPWSRYALGGMEQHIVPGDHLSILQDPGASKIAETLRRLLPRRRKTSELPTRG